ncbi:hypothetical protein KR038_001403 [Drosophila bunnanda]|nr:hypothetical protein KR038_001403 [Drosophila bunnanda]
MSSKIIQKRQLDPKAINAKPGYANPIEFYVHQMRLIFACGKEEVSKRGKELRAYSERHTKVSPPSWEDFKQRKSFPGLSANGKKHHNLKIAIPRSDRGSDKRYRVNKKE